MGARAFVEAAEREYRRYRKYGEGTFDQLSDEQLVHLPSPDGNSIAMVVWHISGNFKSRFTDFLTTDGEKPWRRRDEEFEERSVTRAELRAKWDEGWAVLQAALGPLTDADLPRIVTIRGEALSVHEALCRSLAHTASHVGQIVLLGKILRGADWRTLSVPKKPKA
jgi:hypothetical protein